MKLVGMIVGWLLSVAGVLLALSALLSILLALANGTSPIEYILAMALFLVFSVAVNPLAPKIPWLRSIWIRIMIAIVSIVIALILVVTP